MGSKPKKSDYKPSKAEQMSAEVAAKRAQRFRSVYAPLNLQQLKDDLSDDIKNISRGRGNADVMQGLTSAPSYAGTQSLGESVSDLTQAYQGQLGAATAAAENLQNKRVAGGIGISQGQQADASQARTALANIGNSEVLASAKRNALTRAAKLNAAAKIAGVAGDAKWGDDPDSKWSKVRDVGFLASGGG